MFWSSIPSERIIISHHLVKEGNQKFKGWAEQAEIAYSDDFFRTKKTIMEQGNKFYIDQSYFFAVQVGDEDAQNIRLFMGNPYDKEYRFEPIKLPMKNSKKKEGKLLDHSYTILDTSEGQVFLHINHEGERSKFGNIYISDSTGVRYSTSLHNNVRDLSGQCDFQKIAGVEGIYLSNVYDHQFAHKIGLDFRGSETFAASSTTSKQTRGTPYQAASSSGKGKDKRMKDLDEYKSTLISFDKGAIWSPLKPPRIDANGDRIECERDEICTLHLHSISNMKFPPFYSTENSLGIVLGVGNIGKYLSNKEDEVNTYLSRDGGLNWFEVSI